MDLFGNPVFTDPVGFARRAAERALNRNDGASLFTRPTERHFDFSHNTIAEMHRRGVERLEREREEERRLRRLAQEPRRNNFGTTRDSGSGDRRYTLRFPESRRYTLDFNEARSPQASRVAQWAMSSAGLAALDAGGASVFDAAALQKDPLKYVVKNDVVREFLHRPPNTGDRSELQAWYHDTQRELQGRGFPGQIVDDIIDYAFSSEPGLKNFRSVGERQRESAYTSPITATVERATGSRFLGDLAGAASYVVPVVGAANAGVGGRATGGRELLGDMVGVAGNAVVFGRGLNRIESQVASRVGGRVAASGLNQLLGRGGARLAGNAFTRAGLNVAEDVPLTAAELAVRGVSPSDMPGILGQQAAFSGLAGGAFPLAGAGMGAAGRGARRLAAHPGATLAAQSFGTGAATYGGSRLVGRDDEESRRTAMMAAGAPVALRGLRTGIDRFSPIYAGIMEGARPAGGLRQELAQAAGGSALGFATAGGSAEDRLRGAAAGALSGGMMRGSTALARAAGDSQIRKHSQIRDFRMGDTVHDAASGRRLGNVVRTDSDGNVTVRDEAGHVRNYKNTGLLRSQDYSANITALRERAALRNVTPTKEQVDASRAEAGFAIESAKEQLSSGRIAAQITGPLGRFFDPTVGRKTPLEQSVQVGALASANMKRMGQRLIAQWGDTTQRALAPLMQERGPRYTAGFVDASLHDLGRAGAQLGTAGAITGAGFAASEATGIDELREAGIIGGLVGMGGMSHLQKNRGFLHDKPWQRFELKVEDPEMPKQLRSGEGKLFDVIERPEAYNLPPEAARAAGQLQQVFRKNLTETNAANAAAGIALIPERASNYMFHWFTPGSLRSVFPEKPSAVEVFTPSSTRRLPVQRQRELGDTYYEALQKYPDLKIAGNVQDMLAEQMRQHINIRANAAFVQHLKNSGGAFKIENPQAVRREQGPDAAREAREQAKVMRQEGWSEIPGIDDHLFHPDVIRGVRDLLVLDRGTDNPVVNLLDEATHAVRQAMFVGDLSPWTMQGMMAALDDPFAIMRNAHHLVGASLFGKRYADWWISRNPEVWEGFTRSGGMPGRMDEGLELEHRGRAGEIVGKLSIAEMPGVRSVESRGFDSFLPITRSLLFKHGREVDALVQWLTKNVPGTRTAAHLASGAAPFAPGAAAVLMDDISEDDDLDLLFRLALGVGGGTAIRSGMGTAGRRLIASGRVDTSRIDIDRARFINRTSGNINRQQLGISNRQAAFERIGIARSPTLTRNVLTLAKHAISNPGREGAMARAYLVKTAMLVGVGLAGYKYLETGEWDSFDPGDPESIFSPEGFLRAELDEKGKVSPSNSMVSLMRAVLYQDTPQGETRWQTEHWRPDIGAKQFIQGRLPDITGIASAPLFDRMVGGGYEEEPGTPFFDKIRTGDFGGVTRDVAGRLTPLSVQATVESGALDDTAIGGRLGIFEGDPNINTTGERARVITGSFLGMNFNPETLSQENARRKDEEARNQYPEVGDRTGDGIVTYADLNSAQAKTVREALARDSRYTSTQTELEAQFGEEADPISSYLAALDAIDTNFDTLLRQANREYERTGDTQTFKLSNQKLTEERATARRTIEATLGQQDAQIRGRTVKVVDWLERNQKPEDKAIDEWYGFFDQARNPLTKELDFDHLDQLQAAHLQSLSSAHRRYVEQRVMAPTARTGISGLDEWNEAKRIAAPFWEERDEIFQRAVAADPALSQFSSMSQLEDAVAEIAAYYGLTRDEAMRYISGNNMMLRLYFSQLEMQDRLMRISDPELDSALVKWYGRAPVHPMNRLPSSLGTLSLGMDMQRGSVFSR